MPEPHAGKLFGKIALVTGGASGIGRACSRLLAREGAAIVVTDLQDGLGEECVAGIKRADGRAIFVHQDVANEDDWRRVIAGTKEAFGRLDVLVNNAGIAIAGLITELSLADWRRQQAVNLDGVFLGFKHCLPLMRAGGGGSIICIASTAALVGSSNLVSYSATKGGVRALSKSMAMQCAGLKDGVRVNSIYPGIIETPIYGTMEGAPLHGPGGANTTHLSRDPDALASLFVPLGKKGQPEDIAAGVLYLASDDSRYVTGAELVIDGGMVAR
jgi:NAD(P)-dependent dehydrogenase (short-subunit alcohol dehydrogenase family)